MPSSTRASGAYARVDPEAPSGAALRSSRVIPNEIARARKESLERLSNKVQAFVVVVVAALTLYLSDVVRVALFDENVVGYVPFEIVPTAAPTPRRTSLSAIARLGLAVCLTFISGALCDDESAGG